jgi:uncharacterized protein (TIGR03435 family)
VRRLIIGLTFAVFVTCMSGGALKAQAPQASSDNSFEVASIKPNVSRQVGSFIDAMRPGGRFTATNWTLGQLLGLAYRIRSYQLFGGPGWVDSDQFDIVAKANRPYTSSEFPDLLRVLLTDRFKLTVHSETRELRRYALTVMRPGRLGPRIKVAKEDCAALLAKGTPPLPENGKMPPCAAETHAGRHFIGRAVTMTQFARMLAFQTQATVIDGTELTGGFDIELDWLPETEASLLNEPPTRVDGVSIFTAVREQLGLKLEPKKGPVEVIVIDHAEKPTPD